jgi:tetratricopeptide (TPR) repeat protein
LKTQTGGKFPSESVMYLALADAADGQAARAQEVLEKALAASKKNKGEIRVALGQVYWRRGAIDKAKSQFEEASRDPLDYEGSCALGRLLYSTGDLDGAIAQLQAAVKKNPAHGEARNALGHALLSSGKSEEALAHFSEWQLENPKSALAQRGYALALFRRGKLKESEEALGRAMRLDGQDDESFRLRSALLFARGDPRAAFSALERALKLNGKSAEAQCDMGNAYLRQMSYDKAKRYFESASKLQSRGGCGRVGLALATLGSGGRPSTAEMAEWVKDSNDSWERAEAQAALARVLVAQGSAKEAKKWAEQAVAAEPQLAAGHWVQGLAAARSKEYDKAKEALFRAETLDPAHAEVHLALAELLSHSNSDLERAYQEYQLFLKTSADKAEQAKVKRLLPTLKKRLASR